MFGNLNIPGVSNQAQSTGTQNASQQSSNNQQLEMTLGRAFFNILRKVQSAANENANNGG